MLYIMDHHYQIINLSIPLTQLLSFNSPSLLGALPFPCGIPFLNSPSYATFPFLFTIFPCPSFTLWKYSPIYLSPESKLNQPLPCLLPFEKSPTYSPFPFCHNLPNYDKNCTFSFEIAFLVESTFIFVLVWSLSPFENTTLFLASQIFALERMIFSSLFAVTLDLIIDNTAIVFKLR